MARRVHFARQQTPDEISTKQVEFSSLFTQSTESTPIEVDWLPITQRNPIWPWHLGDLHHELQTTIHPHQLLSSIEQMRSERNSLLTILYFTPTINLTLNLDMSRLSRFINRKEPFHQPKCDQITFTSQHWPLKRCSNPRHHISTVSKLNQEREKGKRGTYQLIWKHHNQQPRFPISRLSHQVV